MTQRVPPEDNQPSQPKADIQQKAENSNLGGGMQGAQGNKNIQNQGNNNWLGNTWNWNVFCGQQTLAPIGNPARPKNQRLLLAAVKEEVTARLRQSLHNAVLINLGKESQPQQVKRPWDAEIKIGLKPAEPLPDTTTILEVFDREEIIGKLLILGAPGSGKTTTQLELAQALVSRAEELPDYPVPVLFNLSSWKDDRQSITNWLVTELKSKYGVSKKLGKGWINNHQLLPLLDGLDELEPQRQELCVQAINSFLAGENRLLYLIVCSRSEEYSNHSTQLQLNGAIYLQPLTNNQIRDYFTSINYTYLWQAIKNDSELLDLFKIPLMLSLAVLAYQEISIAEWQKFISTENRLQYLLNAYIERMLTRDINNRAYSKNKPPNPTQTRLWFVWLAKQMQRESKTEFLIEKIQPDWLLFSSHKWIYRTTVLLLILFFFCLIYSFSLGLLSGILVGAILSLLIGIFSYFSGEQINALEVFDWSWGKANKKLIILIPPLLIFSIVLGCILNYSIDKIIINTYFGLVSFVPIHTFIYGISTSEIDKRIYANQGIRNSAINFGILTFLMLLINIFIKIVTNYSTNQFVEPLVIVNQGLLYSLSFAGAFTGIPCVQHFILRLILYCNGYIPWNYARFLDYCTERLFLQRVGGRYRFIHKLLQDHFAQMEFKRD